MAELRKTDALRLLAFIGDAHTVDGTDPFTTALLDRLTDAMHCEFATYFEFDAEMPTAQPRLTVTCSRTKQYAMPPWPRYRDPPVWAVRPLGDVVFWSDAHARATRWRFELAPWTKTREVVDSAWTSLPAGGSERGAVCLFRQGRDFSEPDRRAFSALGPHLTALIRSARARRRLMDLTAVADAADASSRGYVLLRGRFDIADASPAARRMLASWFEESATRLPSLVEKWLRSGARDEPLTVERSGTRLVIEAPTAHALLVTEEPVIPATITAREREVLRCLAAGKSTGEIAHELWVTPATVSKHLHHIYRKLGVTSRTGALAALGTRL